MNMDTKMSNQNSDDHTCFYHLKRIIIICLLGFCVGYTFASLILMPKMTKTSRPGIQQSSESVNHKGVCKSPECVTLAHQLHNWRDVSIDPCQDFYEAACGKYNEHTISTGTRLSEKSKIVKNLVKEFLDKNEPSESKSEQVMKWFYGRCEEYNALNETENLENMRMERLKLIKKIGSWPMLDGKWKEEDFDMNDMLSQITRIGGISLGFFNLILVKEVVLIHAPSGITKSVEEVEKVLMELLNLSGSYPDVKIFNITSENQVSVEQLQEQVPILDFPRIIKNLFNQKNKDVIWNKLQGKILGLAQPIFFNETRNLQKILETTPKRTLANYLIANLIMQMSMGNQILDCGMIVMQNLPLASLRVFTRNHFNKFNLDMASQLVEDIKESLKQTIQESTWLQEETKKNALLKLKHMKKTIGYPKELEVPGALDVFFESVDMSNKDTYAAAILEIERFQTEQTFNNLAALLPMVPNVELLDSNAFYYTDENHLKLNVAILDDPFFDITYPTYAKIASIGEVIGHEIGHGFDTDGRKRDEKGEERDWWTPQDSKEYDRRTQCLIDQYNNYDDPDYGRNLNGSVTIDEMAADQIGVELSWKIYNRVDFSLEPSIFGFEDEKPDKLFFHLTALNWCGPRPRLPLSLQQEQVHPTHSFRVNGVFRNMKSFAKAFNCPVGSPMNPEKKCQIF
ncbi:hypothetical protein B9Z55_020990 [Caenorhabditis nigoni]|uniref:Peptidase M13 C-terminal domain-containing protein n=2 Tax=Caenorhabditis nigoni TaxID=1611254 RepID=A0A2G5TQ20_9PELO|nr:hypothetical protein B9Z55_020990 [Caenorhabditis nigoni]